jgi:hypothetical protein
MAAARKRAQPAASVAKKPRPPWEDTTYETGPDCTWFVDKQWFDMVYNTADADLRAHRIALTYYYLADFFDKRIHTVDSRAQLSAGPSVSLNANWFHFAMWGTLTVTQNLTTQRSPQRLNSGLPAPLRRTLTPAILRARASDGQRVGRALAWGQLAIFVSATQMVLELTRPPGQPAASADLIREQVMERAHIDMDPTRHIMPMQTAFRYYDTAQSEIDPGKHAWLMFGANVLLTTVEQDLANNAIEVVLDHYPQHIAAAIDWRLAKLSERFRGVPSNLAFTLLESMHPNKRQLIYTVWSRLMTDQVLVMAMPTETLRLGRDIPPRHREWPVFPPDLRDFPDIAGSDELYEIVSLVKSLDRTVANGGTRGSAARDWRRWDERMNWALALIRSRQQDETLFWSPYSVADQWRIINGEMPERVGDASTLDVQAPTERTVISLGVGREGR